MTDLTLQSGDLAVVLIRALGLYALGFALFHLAFRRLFAWPESLEPSGRLNRTITLTLNDFLTGVFFILAWVLWFHAPAIAASALGRDLLLGFALLLGWRAFQQATAFPLERRLSQALLVLFIVGTGLAAAPAVMGWAA